MAFERIVSFANHRGGPQNAMRAYGSESAIEAQAVAAEEIH